MGWPFCTRAAALLAVLLAACGRPQPQPLVFNQVPWRSGEISAYAITDVQDRAAGTAQYQITESEDENGEEGWSIRREILAQGDHEIVVIQVSKQGLRPRSSSTVRTNNAGREEVEAQYDGTRAQLTLTTSQDVKTYEAISIPTDARDDRTILLMARSLPLARNYAVQFNSFYPVTGHLDRIQLTVKGREETQVPAGTFDTWQLEYESEIVGKSIAWIGVEAPNPLVKYVDGRSGGTFELTDFQPGP
jgi:hypothetical protein